MVAQDQARVTIVAEVPGHAPVDITHWYAGSRAEAERWASWKRRALEEQGFLIHSTKIT